MTRPTRSGPFEPGPEPTISRPLVSPARRRWLIAASLACLAALFAFFAWGLSDWNRKQHRPPAWDQAIHLEIALDLRDMLAKGDFKGFLRLRPKPGMPPFPPLYYLSVQPFGGGADENRALWSNFLHLGLLMLALWGIGFRLAGPWRAFAGVLLFVCAPVVQENLRTQLIDLPLTAWVAAAWWAFLACEGFTRLWPSLLFGALSAAAMLTKWSAFSYLLPAALLALSSLRERRQQLNVLLAAAVFGVLAAPWYLDQWPTLIPRLFAATSDGAVSVFKSPGTMLVYPIQMLEGFNPPLLLLGLIAVLVPTAKRPEDKGPLLAWLAFSFVFWTVVPNRQLRFLLPGLPPLALFCAAVWPRNVLIALCGFQLLLAANYPRGWLPEIGFDTPFRIEFFTQWKPYTEDWKLSDILRAADAARESGRPLANLTVVANHPFFNGPTFNWAVRREGLDKLAIRGVNRRVCELSEFVVLKTGSLGPESVAGGLPKVRDFMLDPSGWFQTGWKELQRFPLPDRTEAVLFQQRRFERPPVAEKVLRFDYFAEGEFSARDLRADLGAFDPATGTYPRVRLRAAELDVRGLVIEGVEAELEGVRLIPAPEYPPKEEERPGSRTVDFRLLRIDRARLHSASVRTDALVAFVSARLKGAPVKGDIEEGEVRLEATLHGHPVSAAARAGLTADGKGVEAVLERASVAGLPIPLRLLGRHVRFVQPLSANPELPFVLEIPGLRLDSGRLSLPK